MILSTAQRVNMVNIIDPVNYYRHRFAYLQAQSMVKGNTIEIGCGDGYGIDLLIDRCDCYIAIDKIKSPSGITTSKAFDFFRMKLPKLKNIPSNMFDFAVSFQVIEHLKEDKAFLKEIFRILKPDGTLLLTTPNRLRSVTRNPWHIREYTTIEIKTLLQEVFTDFHIKGIFADECLEQYLAQNKAGIDNLTRLDVFDLQHRLPRHMLRLPYDILNMLYKKGFLQKNRHFNIDHSNFYLDEIDEKALDFFVVARK